MTKKSKGRTYNGSSSSKASQSKLSRLHRKLTLQPRTPSQTRDIVENDQQEILQNDKVYQRGSPMKLVKLYPQMSPEQVKIVIDADFGSLVNIRCSKLNPELCKFLLESFNPNTCELVLPGRGSIPVTEESVWEVIGVPWGEKK